jgi:hypothetical protein
MTPDQLTRAASELEAALARLGIQPGQSTEAELAADDAEIIPALVDGQPVITAEELYRQLACGRGHRCKRGRAPEGYLEIWPDWQPVILYISFAENAKLQTMLDASQPVITPEPNYNQADGREN